uniref:Uncharacterized protein n=1 Tax=Rhizophora mucronata TaxID=61149 RepID=A0A2P2NGY8_RHIMU
MDGEDKQVKFIKCHFSGNPVRKMVLPITDGNGLSSGSEADNPSCDEDMEFIE